jgi:hypothetical protein
MEEQIWFCSACHKIGIVKHESHEDVITARYAVLDAHTERSPYCDFHNVQVLNGPNSDLPGWAREQAIRLGFIT